MRITVSNIDNLLATELKNLGCELTSDVEGSSGVFINYSIAKEQTGLLVDKAIKKKLPMIVFDGDELITDDNIGYLISHGVFLWEPSVCGRNFFSFQPHWGKIPSHYLQIDRQTDDRVVALGYHGTLLKMVPSFEKYYKPVNDLGKHRVCFFQTDRNLTIQKEVGKMGISITEANEQKFSKATVLIDSNERYKTGHLDKRLFRYLESGIVPLLPAEHRWYHSVFGSLVVESDKDVSYILDVYDNTRFGLVAEVYKGLYENLPEADVSNTAKRILAYFK